MRGLTRDESAATPRSPLRSNGLIAFLAVATWAVFAGLYDAGWRDLSGHAVVTLNQIVGSATVAVAIAVSVLCLVRARLQADNRYARVGIAVLAFGGLRVGLGLVVVPLLPHGGGLAMQRLVAAGFLIAIGFLLAPSLDGVPPRLRRPALAAIIVLSASVVALVLASPPACRVLAGEAGANGFVTAALPHALVTAIWLVAARSYWRQAQTSGNAFDLGVAAMLATLAQSRLAITIATLTASSSWLAASQLFRLEAVLVVAVGLNRDLHTELMRSQIALDRLLRERREREHDDAEHRHDVKAALFSLLAAAETLEQHHDTLGHTAVEVLTQALTAETAHLRRLVLREEQEPAVPFSLADAVRPLVVCEDARGQNIRFYVEDDVQVLGRAPELAEAVRNVLDNARTHGSPSVIVRVGRRGETGVVIVEDIGPGVRPEDRRRIFERGERGRSKAHDGSGLGLYLSARLLRDMDGDIWLDENRAVGAAFTCCLPAAPATIHALSSSNDGDNVIDLRDPAEVV